MSQRVQDGVVRRLIGKWLKAGVMEAGALSYRDQGTPQGGVISPILSNIYLHEVLDKWFEWLNRRSRQDGGMTWQRFEQLIERYFPLPPAKAVHSIYVAKS